MANKANTNKVKFEVGQTYTIRNRQMECLKTCNLQTMVETRYSIGLVMDSLEVYTEDGHYDHMEFEHHVVTRELTPSGRSIRKEFVHYYGSFEMANIYYTNLIKSLL